ncbi:MAG TPA: imidazole glycerol phosphate synthase subunit HisH [Bryobacteraceae bacterium]|jgi:imidazole glycerol phosphate synthase glutamine amidotransferase subunit|nr:imidazole glycerol phosphate synthase subunit HisH [Bryobacteraceae bacterium]
MIAIFDYGAGNLRSVQNGLDAIGCAYSLVRDSAGLRQADKIILPGVGHFGQMMRALDHLDVRRTLLERIAAGVPFFGICLGMQALFDASAEAPEARGLGLFAGTVQRFTAGIRVPHMGWDRCEGESGPSPYYYFAHSYYVPEHEYAAEVCDYGVRFTASLRSGNVRGVQYHPEKSGAAGQQVLRSFVAC